MINSKFIKIAVFFDNSQNSVIQLIKIFYFKFHATYLNRSPETIVFNIHYSILVDLVYDILIK